MFICSLGFPPPPLFSCLLLYLAIVEVAAVVLLTRLIWAGLAVALLLFFSSLVSSRCSGGCLRPFGHVALLLALPLVERLTLYTQRQWLPALRSCSAGLWGACQA